MTAGTSKVTPVGLDGQRLERLHSFGSGWTFRPRRKAQPFLLYFPVNGRFVLSAVHSFGDALQAASVYFAGLDNVTDMHIVNLVAVGHLNNTARLNMELLHSRLNGLYGYVVYESELLNALHVKFTNEKRGSVNIFSTGSCVYSGFQSLEALHSSHKRLCETVGTE